MLQRKAILQSHPSCRDISHTPFFVEDKRLGRTSVQEVLEDLLKPELRFSSAKLISAGMGLRPLPRGTLANHLTSAWWIQLLTFVREMQVIYGRHSASIRSTDLKSSSVPEEASCLCNLWVQCDLSPVHTVVTAAAHP